VPPLHHDRHMIEIIGNMQYNLNRDVEEIDDEEIDK